MAQEIICGINKALMRKTNNVDVAYNNQQSHLDGDIIKKTVTT